MNETITVVAATIALLSAVLSVWLAARFTQRHTVLERQLTQEDQALRYREPLLQAAHNLHTRLYSIAKRDIVRRYMLRDQPLDHEYIIASSLYVIGQYFCWVEIIRREAQFMDPGNLVREGHATTLIERVREAFSAEEVVEESVFKVYRVEQRALGEIMLAPTSPVYPGAPRWDCIGFAEFTRRRNDPEFARWFAKLESDLQLIAREPNCHYKRIISIGNAVLDLVNFLDPNGVRITKELRDRL
jgi:hypothetical protein